MQLGGSNMSQFFGSEATLHIKDVSSSTRTSNKSTFSESYNILQHTNVSEISLYIFNFT